MSRGTIVIMSRGKDIEWASIILAMPYRTNREIADKHGLRIKTVSMKRRKLGIPNVSKWDRFEHLLGTTTDSEVARITGMKQGTVLKKRKRAGIPPFNGSKEATLQKEFVKKLDNYEEYVSTDYGEVDVLTDDTIYELKSDSSLNYIHTAIGQLLLHSNAYPDRELFIVVSEIKMGDKVIEAVHKLGIQIMTFDTRDV